MQNLAQSDERLLVGFSESEDCSVYKFDEQNVLLQTLDFITPVVDNPFLYGQIAAANSLSDIFAMGGDVISALNIVGFDNCNHNLEVLNEILQGGQNKIKECGGLLTGGHSIESPEMYYGLSVLGKAKVGKFWRNNSTKVADLLILTKPLGMGVLSTAIKADLLTQTQINEAASLMAQLNYKASLILRKFEVSACTDVSGFGLLGHAKEMAKHNGMEIFLQEIPILQSAKEMADMGIIPAGAYSNLNYAKSFINKEADILLYDAQTSGGLLVAINEKDAKFALNELIDAGYTHSKIIGIVTKEQGIVLKD